MAHTTRLNRSNHNHHPRSTRSNPNALRNLTRKRKKPRCNFRTWLIRIITLRNLTTKSHIHNRNGSILPHQLHRMVSNTYWATPPYKKIKSLFPKRFYPARRRTDQQHDPTTHTTNKPSINTPPSDFILREGRRIYLKK